MCLVLGTAAASLAAGTPGRAHPAHPARQVSPPDGMSWRVYHLMMAQQPLDAAATKIQTLAAGPGPAHAGFFETKVDASTHILTVYWHGPVPANVQRLVSGLRAKVDVQVVKTRYSLATLNRDVLAAIHVGGGVVGGYPLTDGSGIHLSVHSLNPRTAGSVASAMRSRFGVPVVATLSGVDHPQYCAVPYSYAPLGPGSRCYDLENFWGGDVIQSSYVFCTGGFGVHNPSGGEYLMTAAHCAYNGSGYANGITFHNGQDPSHWQLVGHITDVPRPHDWAVIPTGTGDVYYDGPGIYNGDTYHTKTVVGQQATSVGDSLCESGAFGGVLCNFTVRQLNVSLQDPDVPSQTWTALALATSGSGNFTINGDSGGPWFSLYSGCSCVWAKGIHHGLFYNGTEYEVFTPISVATNDSGLRVNAG
jgi:hypothetical protein